MNICKFLIKSVLILSAAAGFSLSDSEARALLKKAEDNTAFFGTDFTGSYSVIQTKPGEGSSQTDAIMYRRDSEEKWTILITAPSKERGKGYLQFDGNIWFYDPADRRFTFTSARDKFQNTNANNSDFAPQHYESNYTIKSFSEEKMGKFDCVLFNLEAKSGAKVDYPTLKLWVSTDGLVRWKEDYSLSGQKLRITAIPSYQKINASSGVRMVPAKMVIEDALRFKKIDGKTQYERTTIKISNISFGKVDDSTYSKPFLEMMSIR